MKALDRIANALEHLAWGQMVHEGEECQICQAKKKPPKRMPTSRVMTSEELRAHEARIRHQRMMAGPEQPVGDTFRYRELNEKS